MSGVSNITEVRKRKTTPPEIRFWKHVAPIMDDRGCWEWVDSREPFGYGHFGVTPSKSVRASRFSWEMHNGPIPVGMHVCHRCDNPPCVNPSHLFLGTQGDNIRDAWNKGRIKQPEPLPCGERNPNAKLSDSQVEQIRSRYAGGEKQVPLAREFQVSQALGSVIVRGEHRCPS